MILIFCKQKINLLFWFQIGFEVSVEKALTEQDLDFVIEGKTIIVKPQERASLKLSQIGNQKR